MAVKLLKRTFPSGKVSLYLDIYRYGTRKKEALGLYLNGDRQHNKEVLAMAEQIRAKRELETQAESYGLVPSYKRKANFVEYCRSLAEQKNTNTTRETWVCAIKHLITFAGESVVFGDLSKDFFERFKRYLLQEISPNAGYIYLSKLKAALNQAMKENIVPVNPAALVSIPTEKHLPVFLTIEEVRILANTPCPNNNVKQAFLFSCFTGLRYSDIAALTWDKVKDGHIEFVQKKTKDPERIPLSEEAMNILARQRTGTKSSRTHRDFLPQTVFFLPSIPSMDYSLKNWVKAAGIQKNISFHKARHTFATMSLSSGVDIYTTSKLLGHQKIQTTEIYAHVIDEKKRQAVAKLPTLNG